MEEGAVAAVGMVLEKKFLTQHPLLGAVVRVAVTPSLHPKWERAMLPHLSQQKWTLRQSAGVVVLVHAAACAGVAACLGQVGQVSGLWRAAGFKPGLGHRAVGAQAGAAGGADAAGE